jgi:peroxiredoxin
MHAWAQQFNTGARLTMIADPSATVAKALGLAFVAGDMGVRARRFAMVIEDGTVTVCNVEAPGKFEVSSAESILSAL